MFDLEREVNGWRDYLMATGSIRDPELEELESHLRDEIEDLKLLSLSDEEAFLIAVNRMGNRNCIAGEFSKLRKREMWKHLMRDSIDPEQKLHNRKELLIVALLALTAGLFTLIPGMLGYGLRTPQSIGFIKNGGFLVIPAVAVYFIWKRQVPRWNIVIAAGIAGAGFLAANLYPFLPEAQTAVLTAIHLPMMLWLLVGVFYTGEQHTSTSRRMDFVRFSGETFIYTILFFCGIGVLVSVAVLLFQSINIDTETLFTLDIALFLIAAGIVAASYLVEARKSVVENLAPILAKIFSPLFLLVLLSYLVVMGAGGARPFTRREDLILFDLLLALVLGMVLYTISSRPSDERPEWFDYLHTAFIGVTLLADCLALSAVVGRLTEFGFTANRTAALGANILLLANLLFLVVLYSRFLLRKIPFSKIEQFQTRYLTAYFAWMAVVVFAFPPLFQFG